MQGQRLRLDLRLGSITLVTYFLFVCYWGPQELYAVKTQACVAERRKLC